MKAFRVSKRWRFGLVAIYGLLILSPFLSSVDQPLSTGPVLAATTNTDAAKDLYRRKMHTYATCLKHISDGDDVDGYNDLFDSGFHDGDEKIPVGFDRDSDNGVMSCTTVILQGQNALDKNGNLTSDNVKAWFIETLTGYCFNACQFGKFEVISGDNKIPKKNIEKNRKALLAKVEAAEEAVGPPNDYLIAARVLPLYNVCYTATNKPPPGTFDGFKLGNSFLIQRKNEDVLSLAMHTFHYTKVSDKFGDHDYYAGDIKLGFQTGVNSHLPTGGAFDYGTDIYVLGNDAPNTDSDGILDCHFIKNNTSGLLKGVYVNANNQVALKSDGVNPEITASDFLDRSVSTDGSEPVDVDDDESGAECQIPGATGFIFCPVIELTTALYEGLSNKVEDLLDNGTLNTADDNVANAKKVWSQFRDLTNIFFVLVFLFVIFSNTLSIGLSNYDIKKMLPRLVIAVILVQFSWVLMQLAFDVSNILAAGIKLLPIFHDISSPSGHPPGAWANVLTAGVGALFAVIISPIGLGLVIPFLLLMLAAIIGVLGVFITLFLRSFIVILLVVISPLAFVCWVLPNTENFFKTWSKMTLRLLFMYPLIVFIFSMAGLFSHIQPANANDLSGLAASIIPILAFYSVPMTFKWAGGAMAAVGGFVTGKASSLSRRASDPAKKAWNETNPLYGSQRAANAAEERKLKAAELFGKKSRLSKFRAKAMTGNYGAIGNARMAAASKKAQKDQIEAEKNKLSLSFESMTGKQPKQAALKLALDKGSNDYQKQAALETMLSRGWLSEEDGLGAAAKGGALETRAGKRFVGDNYDDLSKKAPWAVQDGATVDEKVQKWAESTSVEQLGSAKADSLNMLHSRMGGYDDVLLRTLGVKVDTLLRNDRQMQGVKHDEHTVLNEIFEDRGGTLGPEGKPDGPPLTL